MSAQSAGGGAWAVAALIFLSACGGGGSSPAPPSAEAPPDVPGATRVTGTERLGWNQPGYTAGLLFRAYVDGNAVALDSATCNEEPEAMCSSPLPAMTDGVHTIALAAVSGYGLEGPHSEPVTLQKVSARSVVSAAAFPDARVSAGALRLEAVVTTSAGLSFAADVVARGLNGPLQLASTPDGRLLVADADARVRVIRPGEAEPGALALDARGLLQPSPAGGLGLAVHPDFARNRFVYVSFLAQDGPERTWLRIVRLREVGDTLGEPSTLFEARVVAAAKPTQITAGGTDPRSSSELSETPRLAFGPDGLLYTLLPQGVEFDDEAAASRPHASMLRVSDEGRVPEGEPLSGITAHPLGLAWHPSTAALWLILPGANGEAVVRPSTGEPVSGLDSAGPSVLRMTRGVGPSSGALVFQEAGTLGLAAVFPQGIDHESIGTLRLAVPILADGVLAGLSDRIIDMAPAGGGTLYLATSSAEGPDGTSGGGGDVVLRLRPR
jgi:hypothetical protein